MSLEAIELFHGMSGCVEHLYCWTCAPDGTLLYSNCPDEQPLYTLFTSCGFVEKIRAYARDHDLADPLLSPLFGDFTGFPPTLIQAGSNELLLSDSIRLRDRMNAAQAPCRLEVWNEMWHVFQMFPTRKANLAMESIGRFLLEQF